MKPGDFRYLMRTERKLLIFLLLFLIAAIAFFFFADDGRQTTPLTAADSLSSSDQRDRRWQTDGGTTRRRPRGRTFIYNEGTERRAERFPFDPNTADSTQLLRLGLSPWQVRNIYRYRAKGGVYRHPEDFARLYGLTLRQYRELEPYIRISAQEPMAADHIQRHAEADRLTRDTLRYPVKLRPTEHIVLNTADTTQLKKVPGIGSYWASKIVRYGEQLGGYVAVGQLREIENFPEEALPYFTVSNPHPRQLNVNELSLSQLRRHPYINFYRARAITDYRRLKGNIASLDELRLLDDFPPEIIDKLRPYVSFF